MYGRHESSLSARVLRAGAGCGTLELNIRSLHSGAVRAVILRKARCGCRCRAPNIARLRVIRVVGGAFAPWAVLNESCEAESSVQIRASGCGANRRAGFIASQALFAQRSRRLPTSQPTFKRSVGTCPVHFALPVFLSIQLLRARIQTRAV